MYDSSRGPVVQVPEARGARVAHRGRDNIIARYRAVSGICARAPPPHRQYRALSPLIAGPLLALLETRARFS